MEALKIKRSDIFVVLGHKHKMIKDSIDVEVPIVVNKQYAQGIGTSIACGVKSLKKKAYEAVIILLTDQVYFGVHQIQDLIELYENSDSEIVISKYEDGQGPPSLFSSKYFADLEKLKDDNGGKDVIKKYSNNVGYISFPKGHLDIDFKADLNKLL